MSRPGERLIMAFDFGSRRIGVAVGNELLGSASELAPLPCRDGIPDWERVARLIDEWQPALFVVGLPLHMDGSESEMSLRARKFARRLNGRFGRPFEMFDERGSTREAKRIAHEEGHAGNYRQHGVDGIAAELILSQYLSHLEHN
ncbi:Holliday junction resolvase RuvX [Kushneria phosphatilytica]|uniref:Putative pre-16S rRNA nuclease n=1 Tax=Kushneria phosphatilytica TaxID=657387 RepID=A0A1S1NU13_9GAMM|nr:Holliday junction resolvase RuvX [Kushneria phosphatilytica]OHV08951.1 Holliday junction DNA helicase RuvA [Kushneria phosphatilytica]QEL09714.1 Holliday junction resolvase RuvX [Kushneria phosphatilytica]